MTASGPSGNSVGLGLGTTTTTTSGSSAVAGGRRAATTVLDQAMSSISNFAVGVVVARVAGAGGLGAFSLAYAIWVMLAGFHHALVTDPMAIANDAIGPDARAKLRQGFAAEMLLGLAGALAFALVGAAMSLLRASSFGTGFLAMAPWLPALLVQDYWRWVGFMTRRPGRALSNDTVFNVVEGAAFGAILVAHVHSVSAVVAAWGLGAASGAAWGFYQNRATPSLRGGFGLLKERWSFSKWLAGTSVLGNAANQAYQVVVAAVLGPAGLGSLRAAQNIVMGPAGVLIQAGGSIGLPEASRAYARNGPRGLLKVTRVVTVAGVLSGAAPLVVMAFWGKPLLSAVYGRSFAHLGPVSVIVGLSLLPVAAMLGPILVLKATKATKWIFLSQGIDLVASVAAAAVLASLFGLAGAAWAYVAAVGAVALFLRACQRLVLHRGKVSTASGFGAGLQKPILLQMTARVRRWSLAHAQQGALAAVCLVALVLLVDFMAVSVALPAVHLPPARGGLGASFSQLEWVLEGFVLSLGALVLTAGYVADIVGRRACFFAGMCVFAVGCALAGLAPSALALVAGRVVQGAGAAFLAATGPVLLSEMFGRQSGRVALKVWGGVAAVAVAASPAIGGVVAGVLGWRWLFLGEAMAMVLAFMIAVPFIQPPKAPSKQGRLSPARATSPPLDWRGLGLFSAATAILVVGLIRTTSTPGEWADSGILACFACAVLLLIAFVAAETVAPAPMLDMSLFRQRTFSGVSVASFGLSVAVLGPLYLLVLYLSYDLGWSEAAIGIGLLLLTGMTLPVLALGNWLARRVAAKWLICGGLFLIAFGLSLLGLALPSHSWARFAPGLVIAGAGLELVNPRLGEAAGAAVPPHLAAVASRTSSTFRHLGTALGVAVLGSLFASRLTGELTQATSPGSGPVAASLVLQGQLGLAAKSSSGTAAAGVAAVHTSFAVSLRWVLLIAAVVALASAVAALAVRRADLPRAELVPEMPRPLPDELITESEPVSTEEANPAEAAPRAPGRISVRPYMLLPSLPSSRALLAGAPGAARGSNGNGHAKPKGHVFGAVKSASGAWLPGVPVLLRDRSGVTVLATTTDSAGSYHFSDIDDGHYVIGTSRAGATTSAVEVLGGKAVSADIFVPAASGDIFPRWASRANQSSSPQPGAR